MIGPHPKTRRDVRDDPTGERHDGMPTYTWRSVPAGLATRRQLRAMGLTPGRQPIAAQALRWRQRREPLCAYFFRIELAIPKKPPTPGQLEAARKATWTHQINAAERHGIDITEFTEDIENFEVAA